LNLEPARRLAIERLNRILQNFSKMGGFPVRLQEEVMSATERTEPLFNGHSSVLDTLPERRDWEAIAMTVARIFLIDDEVRPPTNSAAARSSAARLH
jgi:hypothetical protein